jgi:hypothetical protein
MGSSADLEVGDTAGLETCATTDYQFESHPSPFVSLTGLRLHHRFSTFHGELIDLLPRDLSVRWTKAERAALIRLPTQEPDPGNAGVGI